MSIVQVSVIGILGMLLAVQLKQQKAEFAVYLCIGISLIIFCSIFRYLEQIIETLRELAKSIHLKNTYITTLLKMLGVTYISEFSINICKDVGYQTIASQIEVFSKLTILVLSLPILVALLQTIEGFLM